MESSATRLYCNTDISHAGFSGDDFYEIFKKHKDNDRIFLNLYKKNSKIESVSFSEFYRIVFNYAGELKSTHHIRSEDRVLVTLGSSFESYVAYAALLLLKAVIVPIDPAEPPQYVENIFKSSQAKTVINATELNEEKIQKLKSQISALLHIDVENKSTAAAIFYTSGTTGDPKGVLHNFENILINLEATRRAGELTQASLLFSCLPLYHVNAFNFSFLLPLYLGCKMVYQCGYFPSLWNILVEEKVTVASLSPPVIRLLLRDKRAPEPAPHLRYVISASSPLYREEFLAFHEKYGIYIHQAYGLSETVNFTLFTPASVSESDLIEAMTSEPAPSAGQATWGNDLYLIDENGNEILNENSRGELVVRGWSLLQNYYQNREATDRAFSQGWFHTGDMAYYRIIGGKKFYYLCGRIKEVIKRNGKLIYLSEVDQAVKTLGIENSCAVGFKNRYTEEEVGLYVSGPTASGLTEKLRELENALHPDKIPKVLLIGSKIPKTSVGKIKRKELERCFHQFFEMRLDSPFWERAQLQENDYAVLFNKCRHLAQSIAAFKFTNKPSDKIKFIYEEATKLSVCQPMKQNTLHQENLTVFKILNLFEKNLEPILSESVNLVDLIERQENWWQQFMCEYPLGDYGTMAADFLKSENLLGGDILEIGAGVGNTSRKIEKHIVDISRYTRTDLNIKLLEKTDIQSKNSYYNFDKPGRFKNQDVIFGTNALHCAADKDLSLQYLKDMLKPGGCLLLAEGSPETFAGTPWALNFLCGIYDGWWNRGGFLTREEWIQLLQKNGFIHIGWQMMSAGRNDLGGIIWAQKA